MTEILATVYAAMALLITSVLSAVIMYAALCTFGLTDFVADILYSIKEATREIWHMITRR